MKNKKITFFTAYLGGTHGTAKSALDFLRALLTCQDVVHVVAPDRAHLPTTIGSKNLGRVVWFDLPRETRFPRTLSEFRTIRTYLCDCSKNRRLPSSDLVIVNGWASYESWVKSHKRFTGTKAMIVRESPRHFSGPDRNNILPDLIAGFTSFDHLIFVSRKVRSEWYRYPGFSEIPSSFLPNCCEEEDAALYLLKDRDELRMELGLRADEFIVLCPGTIEHRKGQDLLVEALPKLVGSIPRLRILMVGNPSTQWGADLIKKGNDQEFSGYITYWPARPGIMDLLRVADVMAFPSRAEALPRTVLEAMAMGTPIVASDVDGIPELVAHQESALLFNHDQKEDFSDSLIELFKNTDLRQKIAENAKKRYQTEFSREKQFERISAVLNLIMQSK